MVSQLGDAFLNALIAAAAASVLPLDPSVNPPASTQVATYVNAIRGNFKGSLREFVAQEIQSLQQFMTGDDAKANRAQLRQDSRMQYGPGLDRGFANWRTLKGRLAAFEAAAAGSDQGEAVSAYVSRKDPGLHPTVRRVLRFGLAHNLMTAQDAIGVHDAMLDSNTPADGRQPLAPADQKALVHVRSYSKKKAQVARAETKAVVADRLEAARARLLVLFAQDPAHDRSAALDRAESLRDADVGQARFFTEKGKTAAQLALARVGVPQNYFPR